MASQIPPGPNVPIPNGPFYYPQTNNLSTPSGSLIVGAGIFIDNITSTISAGGTGGGITTILPGSGIFVSANVGGIVTVTNTGVLSLNAGTGISLTPGLNGSFTITNTLPATSVSGTVTSVRTGTGLTGGPITTSGTIALSNTTVTAGRYTNATIEVDAQGRITYATTGAGGSSLLATSPVQITGSIPQVISVLNASTASVGVVQLNSSTSSTSTSQAATPSAVKAANDLAFSASSAASIALSAANSACSTANTALATAGSAVSIAASAIPRSSFTAPGQLLAGTGVGSFVALNPGANNKVLTTCAACPGGLFWSTPSTATGSVTQVSTGAGLTGGPITSTGTIALASTSVIAGSYSSANFTVDAYGRILAASNGGSGGTVTSVNSGAGLTGGPITTTGTIALATTAVTAGNYTSANFSVDAYGRITAASNGGTGGTVTSVTAGTGLTGGTITTAGTINLSGTAVSPGSYTNASLTVDQQGRLTAASSGTAPVTTVSGTTPIAVTAGTTPTVSIAAASTSGSGAVQLYDNTNSTSTTLALTAAQGKSLQDQITALAVTGTVDLAGTLDASTGLMASVTSAGVLAGYTVGAVLPAASAATVNSYAIVTEPGTMTPPGGSPTVATRGDWFLVSEVTPGVYSWQFLNVGFDAPAATTSVAGIVCLSTDALAQAGVDATTALTPAAAASAYIPKTCVTGKGAIVTGTAASTPTALGVGTDGQILTACSTAAEGLCWATLPAPPAPAIPCACLTAKGQIITTSTPDTPVALAVGTDGQILTACAAASEGLCWATPPAPPAPAIPCACILAKGDLITGTAANAPIALTVGTNGQLLAACSTCTTGLTWVAPPAAATPTVAGIVLGCTDTTNAALGCNALRVNVGVANVAVGLDSLCTNTTGGANIAVGINSMRSNTTGTNNVAVGNRAFCANTVGSSNVVIGTVALSNAVDSSRVVAIGENALCAQTSGGLYNTAVGWGALSSASGAAGGCNTALGGSAGSLITSGTYNVVIGPNAQVPFGNQSCQLVIGWENNRWITGDSGKNIQPGAGIRDCAGSLGTSGQVLTTTGSAVQWAVPSKGYAYALISSSGYYVPVVTVPFSLIQNSQINLFFNNFVLTAGRTYLLYANIVAHHTIGLGTAEGILRWTNSIGEVGPEIYVPRSDGPYSNVSSWIYKPVAGTESIRINLVQLQIRIYGASSVVITEL